MLEQLPDILTVRQLQEILSIGRSKAYALLRCGEIKCITIGRQIRIPKKYVLDYLQQLGYNFSLKSGTGSMEECVNVS